MSGIGAVRRAGKRIPQARVAEHAARTKVVALSARRVSCNRILYAINGVIDNVATYQPDTSSDVPKPAASALMARYNTLHQLPRSIRRSAIQNELFYCGIYWAGSALSCQLHYTQCGVSIRATLTCVRHTVTASGFFTGMR